MRKAVSGLLRANITPVGWEKAAPEARARAIALVLIRQAGVGDVVATPTRLYAHVETDAAALILRQELAALATMPAAVCPGGCGADLALRECACDAPAPADAIMARIKEWRDEFMRRGRGPVKFSG